MTGFYPQNFLMIPWIIHNLFRPWTNQCFWINTLIERFNDSFIMVVTCRHLLVYWCKLHKLKNKTKTPIMLIKSNIHTKITFLRMWPIVLNSFFFFFYHLEYFYLSLAMLISSFFMSHKKMLNGILKMCIKKHVLNWGGYIF